MTKSKAKRANPQRKQKVSAPRGKSAAKRTRSRKRAAVASKRTALNRKARYESRHPVAFRDKKGRKIYEEGSDSDLSCL